MTKFGKDPCRRVAKLDRAGLADAVRATFSTRLAVLGMQGIQPGSAIATYSSQRHDGEIDVPILAAVRPLRQQLGDLASVADSSSAHLQKPFVDEPPPLAGGV
jgi:hypothetical protein